MHTRNSLLSSALRPLQAFLGAESAGGIVLLAAALAALVWANSPWGDTYAQVWHAKLAIAVGEHRFAMSLEHWVNDGLMAVFFLLVGLEIKRELLVGELASLRRAALPVAAAIGGIVLPALIYLLFTARGPGARGWGVPMATDIAFAVGVLALVGRSVPTSVKVFLLAVAIVDDLAAVLIIAIFYTSGISMAALAVAGALFLGLIALNILRVHKPLPYIVFGLGLWAATLASGLHATIAGVLLAFTIPATRLLEERPYAQLMQQTLAHFATETEVEPDRLTEDQSHLIATMEQASQAVQTALARVEHALLRPVAFVIVPLFALANAGVDLRTGAAGAFAHPVMWGVLLGLLVGKTAGVLLASWLAIKTGIAALPEGATVRQIVGVAVLCGIGFTMSLFVANLAFPGNAALLAAAKVGILLASLLAGIAGGGIIASESQHSA